jgi:hypothetical protein
LQGDWWICHSFQENQGHHQVDYRSLEANKKNFIFLDDDINSALLFHLTYTK